MLTRKEIVNGNLVYNRYEKTYHIISDVGNAREKGDRGESTTPNDELSYTTTDILTGEESDGICEHSGMTDSYLLKATINDVDLYLDLIEAKALLKHAKAKKQLTKIRVAINNFRNPKT